MLRPVSNDLRARRSDLNRALLAALAALQRQPSDVLLRLTHFYEIDQLQCLPALTVGAMGSDSVIVLVQSAWSIEGGHGRILTRSGVVASGRSKPMPMSALEQVSEIRFYGVDAFLNGNDRPRAVISQN